MEHESGRTVVIALLANLAIAIAKFVAAGITRSTSLLAETSHSLADTGNELLLLLAQRRGDRRPDERHRLGYGREAYFWALIASVAVFVAGAFFSLREGIAELVHPTEAVTFVVAYVVLGVSLVLECVSLAQAYGQLHAEADRYSRNFLEHLVLTSDPTTRAVFSEDAAAVTGDVIALVGVGLHQVTGSPVPDGVAAILIGLVLAVVGIELARRNRDFLVGEQAPPPLRERVESIVATQAGVVAVNELLVTWVGPRRLWVVSRVDVDDDLAAADVERIARTTEAALERYSPFIIRADIVTIGPSSERDLDGDAETIATGRATEGS